MNCFNKSFALSLAIFIGYGTTVKPVSAQYDLYSSCKSRVDNYVNFTLKSVPSDSTLEGGIPPSAVGNIAGMNRSGAENCVLQYQTLINNSNSPELCAEAYAFVAYARNAVQVLTISTQTSAIQASTSLETAVPGLIQACEVATESAPSNSSRADESAPSNGSRSAIEDDETELGASNSESGFTQIGSGELISLRECASALEQYEQAENDESRNIVASCTTQYAEDVFDDPSICPQALAYARSSNEAASSRVLIRGTCRNAIVRNMPTQNRRSSGEVSETIAIESPNNQFPPALW